MAGPSDTKHLMHCDGKWGEWRMRKGDATRQEILSIADRLFCTKGYDNTSVQDILDILHGSKGGFYHHFPSKGAVLETLCREKAEKAHTEAEEAMSVQTDTMQRLNTLFRYVNPLRMENMAFMDMLLPLLDRPEGMSVRVVYQEALLQAFERSLNREIMLGTANKTLMPAIPDAAVPVLTLLNSCWLEACMQLAGAKKSGVRCDTSALMPILSRYRRVTEVILDAPYGSVELIELEVWDRIAQHLTGKNK